MFFGQSVGIDEIQILIGVATLWFRNFISFTYARNDKYKPGSAPLHPYREKRIQCSVIREGFLRLCRAWHESLIRASDDSV